MDYWAESMQEGCGLIATSGWVARAALREIVGGRTARGHAPEPPEPPSEPLGGAVLDAPSAQDSLPPGNSGEGGPASDAPQATRPGRRKFAGHL